MTVGSSLSKAGPFIADGVQKEFPYGFSVLDPAHIAVWVDGARTLKGFIVTQDSVVFTEAPPAGSRVTLIRNVPLTQETDIQNNTAFFPEVIEQALDKLTMISQQLEEKSNRSLVVPPGEGEADLQRVFERVGVAETAAASAEVSAASAVAAAAQTQKDSASVREVLEKSAGLPLGAIFPYPGATPPEGAFLLNGQTIYYCQELYPKFWGWVQSNVRLVSTETYETELAATGVCGGFVVNSSLGSVRLPSVVNGTLWGADISNVGNSLAAGLPNIEGSAYISEAGVNNLTGALYEIAQGSGTAWGDSGTEQRQTLYLDASRSNPIYGNSDTVQPPAVRVSWCIQVFNAATELSEQESAQLASLVQTKAQLDLANVDSNLDFVTETWTDGAGGWYRKYRSGWVEQGGYSLVNTGVQTVTLWVEMADAAYSASVSFSLTGTSTDTDGATSCPLVSNRTTTTIRLNQAKKSGDNSYWEVKGFSATE